VRILFPVKLKAEQISHYIVNIYSRKLLVIFLQDTHFVYVDAQIKDEKSLPAKIKWSSKY